MIAVGVISLTMLMTPILVRVGDVLAARSPSDGAQAGERLKYPLDRADSDASTVFLQAGADKAFPVVVDLSLRVAAEVLEGLGVVT